MTVGRLVVRVSVMVVACELATVDEKNMAATDREYSGRSPLHMEGSYRVHAARRIRQADGSTIIIRQGSRPATQGDTGALVKSRPSIQPVPSMRDVRNAADQSALSGDLHRLSDELIKNREQIVAHLDKLGRELSHGREQTDHVLNNVALAQINLSAVLAMHEETAHGDRKPIVVMVRDRVTDNPLHVHLLKDMERRGSFEDGKISSLGKEVNNLNKELLKRIIYDSLSNTKKAAAAQKLHESSIEMGRRHELSAEEERQRLLSALTPDAVKDEAGGSSAGKGTDRGLAERDIGARTWTDWSAWSKCYGGCGSAGISQRYRVCLRSGRQAKCDGASWNAKRCNARHCSGGEVVIVPATWSQWSLWSFCTASCGEGRESRQRWCSQVGVCEGVKDDVRVCKGPPCHELEVAVQLPPVRGPMRQQHFRGHPPEALPGHVDHVTDGVDQHPWMWAVIGIAVSSVVAVLSCCFVFYMLKARDLKKRSENSRRRHLKSSSLTSSWIACHHEPKTKGLESCPCCSKTQTQTGECICDGRDVINPADGVDNFQDHRAHRRAADLAKISVDDVTLMHRKGLRHEVSDTLHHNGPIKMDHSVDCPYCVQDGWKGFRPQQHQQYATEMHGYRQRSPRSPKGGAADSIGIRRNINAADHAVHKLTTKAVYERSTVANGDVRSARATGGTPMRDKLAPSPGTRLPQHHGADMSAGSGSTGTKSSSGDGSASFSSQMRSTAAPSNVGSEGELIHASSLLAFPDDMNKNRNAGVDSSREAPHSTAAEEAAAAAANEVTEPVKSVQNNGFDLAGALDRTSAFCNATASGDHGSAELGRNDVAANESNDEVKPGASLAQPEPGNGSALTEIPTSGATSQNDGGRLAEADNDEFTHEITKNIQETRSKVLGLWKSLVEMNPAVEIPRDVLQGCNVANRLSDVNSALLTPVRTSLDTSLAAAVDSEARPVVDSVGSYIPVNRKPLSAAEKDVTFDGGEAAAPKGGHGVTHRPVSSNELFAYLDIATANLKRETSALSPLKGAADDLVTSPFLRRDPAGAANDLSEYNFSQAEGMSDAALVKHGVAASSAGRGGYAGNSDGYCDDDVEIDEDSEFSSAEDGYMHISAPRATSFIDRLRQASGSQSLAGLSKESTS